MKNLFLLVILFVGNNLQGEHGWNSDNEVNNYFLSETMKEHIHKFAHFLHLLSSPSLDPIADITACNDFVLPAIIGTGLSGNEAYYSESGGAGSQYMVGAVINQSATLYAYDSNAEGSDEVSFVITIEDMPQIDPNSIAGCEYVELPAITGVGSSGASYFTQAGGLGTQYLPGDLIYNSATLYMYAGSAACFDDEPFEVTIYPLPEITPVGNFTACDYGLLPTITGTNLSLDVAYYTQSGGAGTKYLPGDAITQSTILYVYDEVMGCTDEVLLEITVINTPQIDPYSIAGCEYVELPAITGVDISGASYFTQAGGFGTQYLPGDLIYNSATLYMYAGSAACFDDEPFEVTIYPLPEITPIGNITACDYALLPTITGTNLSPDVAYYTQSGGAGTKYLPGDAISQSTILYVYDELMGCTDEVLLEITVINSPQIDPIADVVSCGDFTLPVITGANLSGNEAYYTASGGTGNAFSAGNVIGNSIPLFIYDYTSYCSSEVVFNITVEETSPEIEALKNFYFLTNGDNWSNNSSWLSNCDPCGELSGNDPWYGLTCNGMGKVTAISLPSNNLSGQLPSSLTQFSSLEHFDVSNALLTGTLPNVCGLSISVLLVNNNVLSGNIPACVSNITTLTEVNLSENSFVGDLPDFDQDQMALSVLLCDNNGFTGSIPATYGSISSLTNLSLNDNDLSGCYGQQLIGLCNNAQLQLVDAQISAGNSGLSSWVDFCDTGENACCPSMLQINWSPVFDFQYRASGDIMLDSAIPENANVIMSTGSGSRVIISDPTTIGNGAQVNVTEDGCN